MTFRASRSSRCASILFANEFSLTHVFSPCGREQPDNDRSVAAHHLTGVKRHRKKADQYIFLCDVPLSSLPAENCCKSGQRRRAWGGWRVLSRRGWAQKRRHGILSPCRRACRWQSSVGGLPMMIRAGDTRPLCAARFHI